MSSTEIKVSINAKGVVTGSGEVKSQLKTMENQAKQTESALKKASNINIGASIPKIKSMSTSLGGLAGAAKLAGLSFGAGIIGTKFVQMTGEAIDKSNEFKRALVGLETVARTTGNSVDLATQAAKDLASDGLIPLSQVSAGLKNLLSSGFSLEKSISLFKTLKDSASFNRQGFLSLGEAIVGATEGVKNQNSILVDNAGITRNLSLMHKDYAASIGTTIGKLTEAQKREAEYVGILKEGAKFTGDSIKLTETYDGAMSKLGAAYDRTLAKIGSFITENGLVKSSILAVANAIDIFGYSSASSADKLKVLQADLAKFDSENKFNAFARQDKAALKARIAGLEKTIELEKLRGAQGEYEASQKRKQIDAAAVSEKKAQDALAEETKRLKEVAALRKKIQDAGLTDLQKLEAERDRNLKLVKDDANMRILIEKEFLDKKAKLTKKSNDDEDKHRRIRNQEARKAFAVLEEAANNPFSSRKKPDFKNDDKSREYDQREKLGQGAGLLNTITKGADGAKDMVSGLASTAINAIVPGLGSAIGPLLSAFAEGPDAVKQMVKDFTGALPDVIQGFIEAIPVFIETLADEAPVIIERLAEKAPAIISKLVESAPRVIMSLSSAMPKVAIKFTMELIKNIPKIVTEAARAIFDAISKALGKLTGGILGGKSGGGTGGLTGGTLGMFSTGGLSNDKSLNTALNLATGGMYGAFSSAWGWAKKTFGFAKGGEITGNTVAAAVKGGSPFQDSVPARLMSGETVVDRSLTNQMKDFFNSNNGASSQRTDALLMRMITLLEQPQVVQSSVNLNNKAFADIMLAMSRTNQRVK